MKVKVIGANVKYYVFEEVLSGKRFFISSCEYIFARNRAFERCEKKFEDYELRFCGEISYEEATASDMPDWTYRP